MDSRHKQLHDKANDHYLRQQYKQAAQFFTQALECIRPGTQTHRELQLSYLNKRSVCYLKLEQYDNTVADCNQLLSLTQNRSGSAKALMRKTLALSKLNRPREALETAKSWTTIEPKNPQASKELNRLKKLLDDRQPTEGGAAKHLNNAAGASSTSTSSAPSSLLDPTATSANQTSSNNSSSSHSRVSPSGGGGHQQHHRQTRHSNTANTSHVYNRDKGNREGNKAKTKSANKGNTESKLYCSYCNVQCSTEVDLHLHCIGAPHQAVIMSDDGRDWRFRPPPRGFTSDEYALCSDRQKCRFREQCTSAHSEDELGEWKERYRYRLMKLQRAREKQLHGNSFAEQLLEKWMSSHTPLNVLSESVEDVKVSVNADLNMSVTNKRSAHSWTFTLHCKAPKQLHRLALLYDVHRPHFFISSVTMGEPKRQISQDLPDNCQEWANPSNNNQPPPNRAKERMYRVKLHFTSQIFGTFRQSIVFDFGVEPVLMRRVSVDAVSPSSQKQLDEARETMLCVSERWDGTNKTIVDFLPRSSFGMEQDKGLLSYYIPPHSTDELFNHSVLNKTLTKNNYRSRMHDLLFIEESAQFKDMSRYNIRTCLQLTTSFLLVPSRNVGARYAQDGQLFGLMRLSDELSEDTRGGRLILNSCNTVLLAPVKEDHKATSVVYECVIAEKGRGAIYLTIPKRCVDELKLLADREVKVEIQFQLNRLPLCEMHYAVDKVPDMNLLFPSIGSVPSIPWTPNQQWNDRMDQRLNAKQREAIVAMTTPLNNHLPPIFLVGPYGTGKTFTLAHATKLILQQPNTRILICTHSNSAADLYIKDYLHSYVEAGFTEAKPLRIYFKDRWIQTVHPLVRLYCLLSDNEDKFVMPTKEQVLKYRVVVATLSTSRFLSHLDLKSGVFTHILLDEAAQAMECETIMPLALANEHTRIVLAGDYMQISPQVHSEFARERNLHVSLLERLYDMYPLEHPCKILLCENYRSNEAIVEYTSKLFYDGKLLCSGKQPTHKKWYSLSFFTARGEDIQDKNSTAFYNNAEVFEVVDRVSELQKNWPEEWGTLDEGSIGVVTPYSDQVFRIRAELRKKRLNLVSVERVMNVQGKQFRALFISTVRTLNTCKTAHKEKPSDSKKSGAASAVDPNKEEANYGFLSNDKLLNTAITRAQSLVAVVGDPVSLCSVGKCRKLWEYFIKSCHEHDSLYGISYEEIRAQLSGVEMKKTYILNPLAKEFIPRAFRNQIMGAPVIQGHHQSPGVRSSPVTAQGISRSVLSSPTPTVTSQTAAGHPLGSAPLRFAAHSGMVRSASPMHVIDPFTGQRVLYVPVMPMPVRMVPGSPMYHHPHAGISYVDHHGIPHQYPHHGIHPYGIGPPVRHSPPHTGGPPPQMGALSPSQLSPQQVGDKSAQSKEHTPVKQRGSPLARTEQRLADGQGSSPKAGHPIVPMHGHSPGSHKGNIHSPNIGRGQGQGTGPGPGAGLGPGPGPAHGPGPGEPQALAKLEEMRIQEEFTYLLRTRGQDYANNYLASVRRAQSTKMNAVHPGNEGVNQMEQLLQKLKQQQQHKSHPPGPPLGAQGPVRQQQQQHQQQGLLMQQRGAHHNQGHQNENQAFHHLQRQHQGAQAGQPRPNQDQWHSNSMPSETHNKALHVEVNHFPNNTSRNTSNFLQHPGHDYDVPSSRGSSEPPTPPFVRDLATHDFGANDPSPRTPRTPIHHNNLPPEAFQFPDQYREFNSRPGEPSSAQIDQLSRLSLQIPGRSGSSSSSEHSPRLVNSTPGGMNRPQDVFGNNLQTLNETAFPSLHNANPGSNSHQEWSMMKNSVDRVSAAEMAAAAAGDFRRFSSPVPHNYSPALQAHNSAENSHEQQLQQPQQHHQNSFHPSSPILFAPGTDNQVVPPGPPGAGKEESKQPAAMSYANVLRAPPKPKLIKPQEDRVKTASPDPYSLIKDLGNRQNKDGYYSYFN